MPLLADFAGSNLCLVVNWSDGLAIPKAVPHPEEAPATFHSIPASTSRRNCMNASAAGEGVRLARRMMP